MSDIPDNAPDHCPGSRSERAGQADACAGCPNQMLCASGAATAPPDPDEDVIVEHLSSIEHKIIILSGKGGVGKSTFTAMLSRVIALNEEIELGLSSGMFEAHPPITSWLAYVTSPNRKISLAQIGILDVDICGPSQPRLLGVTNETVHASGSGWSPVYVADNLSVMSIGFLLGSPEDAVIWRGPKKNGMIKQFLKDVNWGPLKYLVIDTPPGTSDEHLSLVKYLTSSPNTGAVIVTTPQEVALQDVRKELTFCKRVNLPVLGVVENMSNFICPKCKFATAIFPPTTGGTESLAQEFEVPFLGRLPLDPMMAKSCDEGVNALVEFPDLAVCKAYKHITKQIIDHMHQKQ